MNLTFLQIQLSLFSTNNSINFYRNNNTNNNNYYYHYYY